MKPRRSPRRFAAALLLLAALPAAAQRDRITQTVDPARRFTLAGHVPPLARAEYDQGAVPGDMALTALALAIAPSAAQQAELDRLLAAQRDPSSPDYRRWLTPDEFAARFGLSPADAASLTAWLTARGFHVTAVARARNLISFTGTARQVENAFGTPIHRYLVHGELHFSNSLDPSLPAAFRGIVTSLRGLNDFRPSPRAAVRRPVSLYTSSKGNHYLAPDDIAALYDVQPLYDAGLNGSGQTIAIVGQTGITLADIQQFRSYFNLTASDPQIVLVPNLGDPGIVKNDLVEANLDIQWAGAVARGASIVYVYSRNVMDAVQYAIDQDLAPVVSMSYGNCEAQTLRGDAQTLRSWAQQANAQGMTWISASGDSGGADCASTLTGAGVASIDLPSGIPEVTSVGGTTLNEGTGAYWNSSNTASKASIIGYIPEVAWNDTLNDGTPSAGGGGASVYFAKPSWQSGPGVPSDGARDVPDISLAASADHDGYLVYSSGTLSVVGGTSASAPVAAGIAAILNQRIASTTGASGVGNINPQIYSLWQTVPGAFHDVVSGDNNVTITCGARSRGCISGTYGFSAGPGYDQATGLGSVDAYQLVSSFNAAAPRAVQPVIAGIANGASFLAAFAPGGILSAFGTQFSTYTAAASSLPLPFTLGGVTATVNGIPAPLYYVSAGQINLQIPESIAPGAATLVVQNGVQASAMQFFLAAAAPGIFAAAMPASASRGEIITLYLTGAGNAANLASLKVTVGGVPAAVKYAGIPSWSAGVVQVNYQLAAATPTGVQPVVVTVAGVASQAVNLSVQ
ncbi:MAG: S8 family serine peptidase [Acidobacteriota bacterium]|nr:S8 family serine peptidase [Acidobacteriota bacterium]